MADLAADARAVSRCRAVQNRYESWGLRTKEYENMAFKDTPEDIADKPTRHHGIEASRGSLHHYEDLEKIANFVVGSLEAQNNATLKPLPRKNVNELYQVAEKSDNKSLRRKLPRSGVNRKSTDWLCSYKVQVYLAVAASLSFSSIFMRAALRKEG